jgi:hypothetical protein
MNTGEAGLGAAIITLPTYAGVHGFRAQRFALPRKDGGVSHSAPRNCAKADQSLGVTRKTSREFHDAAAGPTRSAATLTVLTAQEPSAPTTGTEDHVYA